MAGVIGYIGFEEINQNGTKEYSDIFSIVNIEGMLQETVLNWIEIPVFAVAIFSLVYLFIEMIILIISFLTNSLFYNSYNVKEASLKVRGKTQ